ncbi:unnamed protein product [Paramecium sonneborni]|nr:unnamed protein product [Paramecium sonneborni]
MDKQHQLLQQIVKKSKQDQEDILKNLIMANQSEFPIQPIDNYKQKKMVHLYELEEVQKVNESVCENIVGQFEKNNEANDSTVQEEFQKQQNNLYIRLANRVKKKQDYKKNGGRLSNSSINVYQVPFQDYDERKLES